MPTTRKRPRMRRTQISLPEEELNAVREFAARRGTSMSRVFRSGVKKELGEEEAVLDAMLSIVGIVKGADPDASEKHDEILYQ
jgi:metal-responsive CopG/Arc/MetJ family transcriptional regulator